VGGNIQNSDQTLASAVLAQVNDYADYPYALAIGIVLLGLILILIGMLTLLQQRTSGINLRFRAG
jgi:ABC-type sulfate transport system permease component